MASDNLRPLSLETLNRGKVAGEFNAALERAVADVRLRPQLEKVRTVKLTVAIRPKFNEQLLTNTPDISYSVDVNTPGLVVDGISGIIDENGVLQVQGPVEQMALELYRKDGAAAVVAAADGAVAQGV